MGKITKEQKEQYEYRQESAERRMEENAKIKTLTQKQHELLAEVSENCGWYEIITPQGWRRTWWI